MTSRQGEQQALINCERNEQFMYSEYQQSLVHCKNEMNQGVNQAEVTALQVLDKCQSEELNTWQGSYPGGLLTSLLGHTADTVQPAVERGGKNR
eukprot:12887583-Prorocentrum_lima.AAC.1